MYLARVQFVWCSLIYMSRPEAVDKYIVKRRSYPSQILTHGIYYLLPLSQLYISQLTSYYDINISSTYSSRISFGLRRKETVCMCVCYSVSLRANIYGVYVVSQGIHSLLLNYFT